MIHQSVDHLIGNTPLVRIPFPELPEDVTLYGKLEGNNPAGSVKDRPAYNMLAQALKKGSINRNSRLVEATSGNTGIALAMVSSAMGLEMTLIMPDNATTERIAAMEAYGAKVILTPAEKTIEYSRELADQMVQDDGYIMMDQFNNPDNYLAHYKTTGPEIWRDTEGKITHFVASMGTTGTITGNSKFLKEQNENIKIIGVQPKEGSNVPGIRKWSPEFLPRIYDPKAVDELQYVSSDEAKSMMRRLSKSFGIFAGPSSGGAALTALNLGMSLSSPALIVCVICDRGDRYLSSGIFKEDS